MLILTASHMLVANLVCIVNVISWATLILMHTCRLLLFAVRCCRRKYAYILTTCNSTFHLSHSLDLLRRMWLVKVSDRMRTLLSRLHQSLHCLTYVVFVTFDLIIYIIIIAHIVYILNSRALILFKLVQICSRGNLFTLTLVQLEWLSVRDNFSGYIVILICRWAASLQSWRSWRWTWLLAKESHHWCERGCNFLSILALHDDTVGDLLRDLLVSLGFSDFQLNVLNLLLLVRRG